MKNGGTLLIDGATVNEADILVQEGGHLILQGNETLANEEEEDQQTSTTSVHNGFAIIKLRSYGSFIVNRGARLSIRYGKVVVGQQVILDNNSQSNN